MQGSRVELGQQREDHYSTARQDIYLLFLNFQVVRSYIYIYIHSVGFKAHHIAMGNYPKQ